MRFRASGVRARPVCLFYLLLIGSLPVLLLPVAEARSAEGIGLPPTVWSVDAGAAWATRRGARNGATHVLGLRIGSTRLRSMDWEVMLATLPLNELVDLDAATALPLGDRARFIPRAGANAFWGSGAPFFGWNVGGGVILQASTVVGLRLDASWRSLYYCGYSFSDETVNLSSVTLGIWIGRKLPPWVDS